ncbi:MAG: hypothetical protein KF758_13275 [Anaerolineales bacterium]|nr:hypothetical protein [Anaerolineales bacterium]
MYKALDIRDNKEVIILNPKWLATIEDLRELGRQDLLVCQGCKQPVSVRAGIERREHFAHKHLANCDYSEDSAALSNARAALYEWLVSKFGENVSIEKKIEKIDLFRPVDCWVEHNSTIFAYWIFDSKINREKRNELLKLSNLGIHTNWIFLQENLKTVIDHPDRLILPPTQREFIQPSKYDYLYSNNYRGMNGSLHYLDYENKKMITSRCLSLYHHPQMYKGTIQSDKLENILVSPENGEFVYKNEVERLKEFNTRQDSVGRWKNISSKSIVEKNQTLNKENIENQVEQENSILFNKTGKCRICGQITSDWLHYFGATGECICRTCSKKETS